MIAILKIREIRLEKKLTQLQLCELSGISQSYLSELENNKKSPTLNRLCKIAEALDVQPEDLYYVQIFT